MITVLLIGLALVGAGFPTLIWIGLYVVTKHPYRSDPRRNDRRYVVPAGVAAAVLVVGLLFVLVGGIGTLAGA